MATTFEAFGNRARSCVASAGRMSRAWSDLGTSRKTLRGDRDDAASCIEPRDWTAYAAVAGMYRRLFDNRATAERIHEAVAAMVGGARWKTE